MESLTHIVRGIILILIIQPHAVTSKLWQSGFSDVIGVMMSLTNALPACSYIFFIDSMDKDYDDVCKEFPKSQQARGLAVYDLHDYVRSSTIQLNRLTLSARKVRLDFTCVSIMVFTRNLTLLVYFAESSLKGRLIGSATWLVVLGDLERDDLGDLFHHWTFSMMNSIFILPYGEGEKKGWDAYTYIPYPESSNRHLIRVANWNRENPSLQLRSQFSLFPQKFKNLHGATINVTALPYEPYWMEELTDEGVVEYSGSDWLMLEAMAETLNFSVRTVPVETWDEAVEHVMDQRALVTCVIHGVYPARKERFDFTRTYEHDINLAFVMAKPVLEPKWQSLYYPLSDQVWLLILLALLMVFFSLAGINRTFERHLESCHFEENISTGLIFLEVFGTLLGQGLSDRLPPSLPTRFLLVLWLAFAFVVGTIYKGNLVASLVAPRYPPRPETLKQLVQVVDRVTMPSYGNTLRELLRNSEAEALRAIGNMMELGFDTDEGLQLTMERRYPHLGSLRFLQHQSALHYTEADGTSPLYIGREGLMPILNAWPIPHDAPYKDNFDFVILALIESGIYNKWMEDWLNDAKKVGRLKKIQLKKGHSLPDGFPAGGADEGESKALTIVHLQGPLMILGVGVSLAGAVFIFEYIL